MTMRKEKVALKKQLEKHKESIKMSRLQKVNFVSFYFLLFFIFFSIYFSSFLFLELWG